MKVCDVCGHPRVYDYIFHVLKDEAQCDAFGEWAFGKGYREITDRIKYMQNWNTLHGHELMLIPSHVMTICLDKMIELWKNKDDKNVV